MRILPYSSEELVDRLLSVSGQVRLSLLDSCGIKNLGSRYLIAGIDPIVSQSFAGPDAEKHLFELGKMLRNDGLAYVFSISYDFGAKLQLPRLVHTQRPEPDIFINGFDHLIVHDYETNTSFLTGEKKRFFETERLLRAAVPKIDQDANGSVPPVSSNFSRDEYLAAIETIKEFIRAGDTYQTNLTRQFSVDLENGPSPSSIFRHLRKEHPAPFSAFIDRGFDHVISISPERFFKIDRTRKTISVSPIKGTVRRGSEKREDRNLREQLVNSPKNRAENVMIVDLMRNDIGRVCEYGSVNVRQLCAIEEHPTLFHLVSTVSGKLRENIDDADVLRGLFPCGSITGAPKLRTMEIIEEVEKTPRGLSTGAIGYSCRSAKFEIPPSIDMSVAIRTIVVRGEKAVFNVGGGIVIDSDPESEYDESLLKAKAIFSALNVKNYLK